MSGAALDPTVFTKLTITVIDGKKSIMNSQPCPPAARTLHIVVRQPYHTTQLTCMYTDYKCNILCALNQT